jgi:hypothetical protein
MRTLSSPALVLVCRSGAALLLAMTAAVQAQPQDAPPRLAPGTAQSSPARPESAPTPVPPTGPIIEDEALADLAPTRPASPQTRIEQRRQGNRIVELTVTPAGSNRSYLIVNREGQRPLSVQELSAGLSTPRFIKFDF